MRYSILILMISGIFTYAGATVPEGREIASLDHFQQKEATKHKYDPGQGGVMMSLAECLRIGLEKNYDILIEKNNERVADNNATKGNAGYYPSVGVTAGYSGSVNNTRYEYNDGSSHSSNGVSNSAVSAGLEASWMLFDGFNVRTTYKRLLELQKLGQLNTRLTIEEFITTFSAQYYNYIRQYRRFRNLQYAVSLSMERMRIVQAHYQIGSQSRLDLQQANVDLNSDRSLLIQQYETMHMMRTLLNQLLANNDIEFPIIAADSLIEYSVDLSYDDIAGRMMAANTYLEIIRSNEDVSRLDLKIAQSQKLPYVRINTGYGYTQNWYGSGSYDQQRNLGLNYSVSVGVNLFDGLNQRRRERNARIEIQNREMIYAQAELAMRKTLSDEWMSYTNNITLTNLEAANLETATDTYNIAMERYRLGQLSGIELREAQNNLLAAEERLIQAQFETKISEINLLSLSGEVYRYLE